MLLNMGMDAPEIWKLTKNRQLQTDLLTIGSEFYFP